MLEVWYRKACSHCHRGNWAIDCDDVQKGKISCWACGTHFWIDEEFSKGYYEAHDLADSPVVLGIIEPPLNFLK